MKNIKRISLIGIVLVLLGVVSANYSSAAWFRLSRVVKGEKISKIPETQTQIQVLNSFPSEAIAPGELLVKWRRQTDLEAKREILNNYKLKIKREVQQLNFSNIILPSAENLTEVMAKLQSLPAVEYVEPNYIAQAFFVPNDPLYPNLQWNLKAIGLEEAWQSGQGEGVVVAVVDTGIAYEDSFFYRQAPDLAETDFVAGWDFVNNDSHPNDDNGHGTHVAGTIAQSTNNNLGAAGVAGGASLMPVKVLNSRGNGTYATVAEGIVWAVDNGADIINLSLGGPAAKSLEDAVRYAYENNVLVVAAAGNDGRLPVACPACYDDYVLAVGAVRYDLKRAVYSNYGASLDLVAPGGDLSVDQNGDGYSDGILQQTLRQNFWWADPRNFGYYLYQGTSMAAPHVAGVAALVKAQGVKRVEAIKDILINSARDLGTAGYDIQYGWGLVDAANAVILAKNSVSRAESTPLPSETNLPPIAQAGEDLSLSDSDGSGKETVLLDGSNSDDPDGVITSWQWLIGSQELASGKTVTVELPVGTYLITLKVTDDQGASSTDELTVAIKPNQPPQAEFNVLPINNVFVGDEILFDGSNSLDSDGQITSYNWDFGDQNTAAGKQVSHSYSQAGNFTVVLTVTDNGGLTNQSQLNIVVNEAVVSQEENNSPSSLAVEFNLKDKFGNKKTVFKRREGVFAEVVTNQAGAEVTIDVYDPWFNRSVVLVKGKTDERGYLMKGLGSFRLWGEYGLILQVEHNNEVLSRETSFTVVF